MLQYKSMIHDLIFERLTNLSLYLRYGKKTNWQQYSSALIRSPLIQSHIIWKQVISYSVNQMMNEFDNCKKHYKNVWRFNCTIIYIFIYPSFILCVLSLYIIFRKRLFLAKSCEGYKLVYERVRHYWRNLLREVKNDLKSF